MELRWRRILCPLDFSDESRTAVAVAADVARRFGAELTMLHVEVDGQGLLQASGSPGGQLADWKREAEALHGGAIATVTRRGAPADAIVSEAAEGGFDLVVMGTHGRTGRDHALIGSVAESVVRRSRVPVLTVHADWQR